MSGLVDGEVTTEELTELEELAVATDTTLDVMTADLHELRSSIARSMNDVAPPDGLRKAQLSVAVDAIATPHVDRVAPVRAVKRHRFASPWATPGRLQWAGSIAAGLLVVAGIGFVGVTAGRGSDQDSAGGGDETASEPSVPDSSESVASLEMTDAARPRMAAAASADLARAPLLAVQPVDPRVRAGDFSEPNPVHPGRRSRLLPRRSGGLRSAMATRWTRNAWTPPARSERSTGLGIVEQDQDLFEVYRFEDGSTAVLQPSRVRRSRLLTQ